MDDKIINNSYLLGYAVAKLYDVQKYLILGDHQNALSDINECIRYLKEKIDQQFKNGV